ncbi:MAG: FAD-binding oxidoreductase [Chloroflexi bacterium]|nr:FAD-binding oxidoreductase [Chloroflexota bacterium]
MKRWNGWGNVNTDYPVPPSARAYLDNLFGSLDPQPDATYEAVLKSMPASRLPAHSLVDISAEARLTHARGQSLSDWVALRSGHIPAFPDGVAFPTNEEQVRDLMAYAKKTGARVIPYGGGTSVVGHINPLKSDAPALTLSLEKMTRLLELDEFGRTAVFEAGVTGPELEQSLAKHGYTLGHFPQSHEYSTLGGWIAARSSGQQSYYYGRIEQLFAGGRMETPRGLIELPHFPASAAGPDVKEMVLGSEGRMGVITSARVRISPVPQVEEFYGVFFPSWEQGADAVRQIAQERLPVSMLRLSNPQETETTLILSGKSWVGTADKGLTLIGYGAKRCLLVFGVTGSAVHVRRTRAQASVICRRHGGLFVGTMVGHTWKKNRFYAPYLRNTLWEIGVVIDTLETAIPWPKVMEASQAIPASIVSAMEACGEKVLAFVHLSHIYRDAASIYTTFLFRRPSNPDELLARWQAMKQAASLTIQKYGGTITHQHGVGTDHAPYLPAEKGALGMDAIRAACESFDPDGMMNPGKLF